MDYYCTDTKRVNIISELNSLDYATISGETTDYRSFINFSTGHAYRVTSLLSKKPNGLQLEEEVAKEQADQLIQDLNIANMQLNGEYIASECIGSELNNDEQCYVFIYTRNVDGIPFTYAYSHAGDTTTADALYIAPIPQETIEIYINDTGIVEFTWSNKYVETDYVSNNVKLLPFEEVRRVFLQQMKMEGHGRNNWYGNNGTISDTINVYRSSLGMMVTLDKDNPNTYLAVPVWDFFVTSEKEYTDGKIEEDDKIDYSILTINAIDGSIINRYFGY